MDGFVLKKIVSLLLHVIPGALFLLLGALLLRRWYPRFSTWLSVLVCVLLLLGSTPPVSNALVGKLENRYPVLPTAPEDTAAILVLGYGHTYTPERPANSVLMAGALSRVTEGVRLWKTRPESVLILSGAKFLSDISHAEAMQRMAIELGVPPQKTLLLDHTRDTEDEIVAAVQYLRQRPTQPSAATDTNEATEITEITEITETTSVALSEGSVKPAPADASPQQNSAGNSAGSANSSATASEVRDRDGDSDSTAANRLVVTSSATHLPRAALMLERQQIVYSVAPTDFLALEAPWFRLNSYFLHNLDRAIHEWVGMAWYRWRP